MDRFEFLTDLKSIYDKNSLSITEYQNEIQDIMDEIEILNLSKAEAPFSFSLENQTYKSDNITNSNPTDVLNSRLKAEYDLSIWNENLRHQIVDTDIKISNLNITLKRQDEKYNIFKLLLDISYTKSLMNIYESRVLIILRNIENFSLRRELGENTIKEELQAREEFLKTKNKRTSAEVRLLGFVDELESSLDSIEDDLPLELFLDINEFKPIDCPVDSVSMQKLKAEEERANLDLRLQNYSRLPVFTAFSSLDYDWQEMDDPASGRIGFNLNLPLSTGGQTSRKVSQAKSQIEGIRRKIERASLDLEKEVIRRAAIEDIFILNLNAFGKELDNRVASLAELRERESLGQTVFGDLYATQSEISLLNEARAGILKEFFETYLLTVLKFGRF